MLYEGTQVIDNTVGIINNNEIRTESNNEQSNSNVVEYMESN